MIFSYYPGCSLESTAWEYGDSAQHALAALGVELHEIEGWNCCGASSAHSLNRSLSLLLPARNLAIVQAAGRDVVMPCAACFNRHKTVEHLLQTSPGQQVVIDEIVGFHYNGSFTVRNLLDIVCREIGLEQVRSRVIMPLAGLKVVPYYGCLLVRPPEITQFDHPEHPVWMERLLETLGAEPRPWSHATDCCGGGLSLTRRDVAAGLVGRLVERANEAGAQAIVTSCPLCQVNLEMRQGKAGRKMPVFYFTELMGLAFGLERTAVWWRKHLIDPTILLQSLRFF